MIRPTKRSFPHALISSALGTVLVSLTAVWLATSTYAVVSRHDAAPAHSSGSSSHQFFRLSPIPPGADWTS